MEDIVIILVIVGLVIGLLIILTNPENFFDFRKKIQENKQRELWERKKRETVIEALNNLEKSREIDYHISQNLGEAERKLEYKQIRLFLEKNLLNFSYIGGLGWYKIVVQMLVKIYQVDKDAVIKRGTASLGEFDCCTFPSNNQDLNKKVNLIIDKFSSIAYQSCEICGKEGKPRDVGDWNQSEQILCFDHYLSEMYRPLELEGNFIKSKDEKYDIRKFKSLEVVNPKIDTNPFQELRIYTMDMGKEILYCTFRYSDINYYYILKSLPKSCLTTEQSNHIDNFFKSLEVCEICGYHGLYEEKCLCCGHKTWEVFEYKNCYSSKKEYIKESQMDVEIDEDDDFKIKMMDKAFIKSNSHKTHYTQEELEAYKKD